MPPLVLTNVTAPLVKTEEKESIGQRVACALPRWVTSAFGLKPDTCKARASYKGPTSSEGDAYRFYDGLMGKSPDDAIEFTLYGKDANGNPTGRAARRTTSVRELAKLSSDWREKTNRLQTIVDRFKRDGLVTDGVLSQGDGNTMLRGVGTFVTQQTRASQLADPTGLLRAPFSQGRGTIENVFFPTDPRSVPAWYPNVSRNAPVVSLTPRILDKSLVSTDNLRRLYQDLLLAMHGHLTSRNAVPCFHPVMIASQAHIAPSRHAYSYINDNSGGKAIEAWAANNGNANWLQSRSIFGYHWPDGDQRQGPLVGGGEYQWVWEAALEHRFPITVATDTTVTRGVWNDSESHRTWNTWTADPILELLRLLNGAEVLLRTGNAARDPRAAMVDVFACQAVYHGAQESAYRMIGRPMGSNVLGYRERMAQEILARKAAGRGDLGVPGYESSGDDAADITMGSIGCVALAVRDAIATGGFPVGVFVGIVSFLIRAGMLMATFLGEEPQANPYNEVLRMAGGRTAALNGISVKNALELPPMFEVR